MSHGPKVIPPSEVYDTARYGDRPFPIIPVQYTDRTYLPDHSGEDLAEKINSPAVAGSTFNLYQEMSIGQLFPNGTVPSAGDRDRRLHLRARLRLHPDPGPAQHLHRHDATPTCRSTRPAPPLYPERITNGVYNLPGMTQYYGADSNGSAVVGSAGRRGRPAEHRLRLRPDRQARLRRRSPGRPRDRLQRLRHRQGRRRRLLHGRLRRLRRQRRQPARRVHAGAVSDTAPYDNIWPH